MAGSGVWSCQFLRELHEDDPLHSWRIDQAPCLPLPASAVSSHVVIESAVAAMGSVWLLAIMCFFKSWLRFHCVRGFHRTSAVAAVLAAFLIACGVEVLVSIEKLSWGFAADCQIISQFLAPGSQVQWTLG